VAQAIVAAMPDELAALLTLLDSDHVEQIANRRVHHGRLAGREVLLVLAGIGKVAAATTTAVLLDHFAVESLLFTGVAGGLGDGVNVGDVVVGDHFLQHDMDTSPIFPRWEVPGTGRSRFSGDPVLADALARAAAQVLSRPHPALASFGIAGPRLHRGLIISGDRFVSSAAECARLRADLPDAMAVEMEGAAVAQVCADFARPFGVLRTISDRADDLAHADFPRFLRDVAAEYARDVVLATLSLMNRG
jgi:adenosylhomocysteine nucleosidase